MRGPNVAPWGYEEYRRNVRHYPFATALPTIIATLATSQALAVPIVRLTTGNAPLANRMIKTAETDGFGIDPWWSVADGQQFWERPGICSCQIQFPDTIPFPIVGGPDVYAGLCYFGIGQAQPWGGGALMFTASIQLRAQLDLVDPKWELFCNPGNFAAGNTIVLSGVDDPPNLLALPSQGYRLMIEYQPQRYVKAFVNGKLGAVETNPAFLPPASPRRTSFLSSIFVSTGSLSSQRSVADFCNLRAQIIGQP